jgi:hypothetical protein
MSSLLGPFLFILLVMNILNNIMVWNCRGAASSAFYRYCNQYVVTWKPVMLVIMETRCNPDKLKKTFNLMGYDGFLATENSGFAGGIIVAWKVGHG